MNINHTKLDEVINNEKNQAKKIEIYFKLYEKFENIDLKYSYELAKKGYELSLKLDIKNRIAEGLIKKARVMFLFEKNYEAISFLFDALQLTQKENDFKNLCEIYSLLGNIYTEIKNYDVAYNYYTDALDIATENDFKIKYAIILNNVGELYKTLKGFDKALEYYDMSLQVLEKENELKLIGIPMLNIGNIFVQLNNLEKALEYTKKSLDVSNKYNDKIGVAHAIYQLGVIEKNKKNDNAASKYYNASFNMIKKIGDKQIESNILNDLNELHIRAGRFEIALENLDKYYKVAKENNNTDSLPNIFKQYYQLYEYKGDFKSSYLYLKKYNEMKDKILEENSNLKLKSFTLLNKIQQTNTEKETISLKNKELSKKTKELQNAYSNIRIISEIAKEITSIEKLDEILDDLYDKINSLMSANVLGIGIYDEENNNVNNKYFIQNNIRLKEKKIDILDEKSLITWSIRNKSKVFINDFKKEVSEYIQDIDGVKNHNKIQSLIICPLIIGESVLGVITIQSIDKNTYTTNSLDIINVLSSYISVVFDNDKKAEKLSLEIAERKHAQEELLEVNNKLLNLSQSDGLTGIPNRRRFDEYSEMMWSMCKRNKKNMSMIIIDIDKFKEFNDNYGHLSGDKVIKFVATTLKYTMKRSTDLMARFGGDEFIAVLPNTDKQGAIVIARKMMKEIKKLNLEHKYSSVSSRVTVSMGISSCIPNNNNSVEKLVDCADKALYETKSLGRNGFRYIGT